MTAITLVGHFYGGQISLRTTDKARVSKAVFQVATTVHQSKSRCSMGMLSSVVQAMTAFEGK
jgi:hypothetical protein